MLLLDGNRLATLPESIGALEDLWAIDVSRNPSKPSRSEPSST